MTLYLSFRSHNVDGSVAGPQALTGDGRAPVLQLRLVGGAEVGSLSAGKNVLFGVHGFNVSLDYGARSLAQLEPVLHLKSSEVFIGVLWPGDFWLPVVNYPFEGSVAMECGRRLADFCNRFLSKAQSLSFVSHSLGVRVVLEAVKNLDRPAQVLCLTAAAINRDCLATEYARAAAKSSAIAILASHEDWVLKLAYPIGDPISDLLHEDHSLFQPALGYGGPPIPTMPPIHLPWQIPDGQSFEHPDYLPPADTDKNAAAKWRLAAAFMARAFRGEQQTWP